jgi:hypothetical protein
MLAYLKRMSMWQRLKRPTAERREAPWTGPTRFDEVQTKETQLASADLFKLRLNGSDHLFLSIFMADVGEERTVEATDGH